jgi:hypothetical protein
VPRKTVELSWVEPGYWRVLHKTFGTSNCDWDTALAKQRRLLGCGWKRAPLTVLAVALVMHWAHSPCDHRDEETFRCGDLFSRGQWSQCIDRFCGNLILDSAADRRVSAPNVWLASAQYVG